VDYIEKWLKFASKNISREGITLETCSVDGNTIRLIIQMYARVTGSRADDWTRVFRIVK
jgi:hypothetical protein